MKTLSLVLLALLALLPATAPAAGDDVYLFWRDGCPHCEKELAFLQQARQADATLRVHRYEIGEAEARRLYVATAAALGQVPNAVPFTVVGDRFLVGYYDDASTGRDILAAVTACRRQACPDIVGPLAGGAAAAGACGCLASPSSRPRRSSISCS